MGGGGERGRFESTVRGEGEGRMGGGGGREEKGRGGGGVSLL